MRDLKTIGLENNIQLTGQLPQTMGNMSSLFSLTLILNGPTFGGELPSALFRLPNLKHIHFQDNLGDKWSLPSNVEIDDDAQLERFILSRNTSPALFRLGLRSSIICGRWICQRTIFMDQSRQESVISLPSNIST